MVRRADRTASGERALAAGATAEWRNPSSLRAGETADILNYMAQVRRKARRNPEADPLVAEIVEALLGLGGQGHRTAVAERIASARAGEPTKPTQALIAHVRAAFEERLELDRAMHRPRALFDLPFGDGSHRWALAREAENFLRWGRESRRSPP